MAEYSNLKVTIEDRVGVLTIDHPPANAFDGQTLTELDAAVDELLANDQVKVIIITGAGQFAFVAGLDLKEAAEVFSSGKTELAHEALVRAKAIYRKIECSPKPVIAAINAVALGGGLELALSCHIRIMADRARVGLTETNLGLIPGWGGTQRLQRVVGQAKALELILSGDMINAQEAFRLGLANKVVPAGQVLFEAMGLAKKIAAKSKLAIAAAMTAVVEGGEMPLDQGLEFETQQFLGLVGSHDLVEGVSAFVQKRQPKFTDS
jgi:enoyl-CoA hydratase/carnithine racemase